MKIWHLVNSLCVVDGGSFIIKSIAFLTTSGGCQNQSCLTMAIFCGMIYDSLQPVILNCGTFLLKIYLEYYK